MNRKGYNWPVGAEILQQAFATGEACPQATDPTTDQVYLYSNDFSAVPVVGPTWDVDLQNGTPGAPPTLSVAGGVFTISKTLNGVNANGNAAYVAFLATYAGWDTGVCGVFVEAIHRGQTGTLARYKGGLAIGINDLSGNRLAWDTRNGQLQNPINVNVVTGIAIPNDGDKIRLQLRRTTYTQQIAECLINNVVVASSTGAVQPTSATPKRVGMFFFGNNSLEPGLQEFTQKYSDFKVGVI